MGLGRTRLQNRSLLFLRPRRRMFNGYRLVLVFHSGQAESASAASWPAAGSNALATGRIANQVRGLRSDDNLIDIRLVCGNRDAGLLRLGRAEPMVHPRLCRSLRARFRLRLSAGSVAVRISRGRLVCGRDTALGAGRTLQVIRSWWCDTAIFAAVIFVTAPHVI